jgi:hypothetical protein
MGDGKSELALPRVLGKPSEKGGDVGETGREAFVGRPRTMEGKRAKTRATLGSNSGGCDDEVQPLLCMPQSAVAQGTHEFSL